MDSHPPQLRSKKEVIDALTTARDSARVHLHLMSLDARERWRALESRIDTLQSKVEREGERVRQTEAPSVRAEGG